MPRLRNRASGVVVNVSDEKAARLGSRDWEPVETPAPSKARAPRKRATPKQK